MKEAQEQHYYNNLNDIINRYNRKHFNRAVVLDDAYTGSLAEYVMQSYPRLTRNIVSNTVYTVPETPFTRGIIQSVINRTRKGTLIAVRDAKGNHTLFANAGTGETANKKRILVMDCAGPDMNTADPGNLVVLQVLKNDIRYVLTSGKFPARVPAARKPPFIQTNRPEVTPKGKFERHFKNLVKEQGRDASPDSTARFIFSAMAFRDKKKLSHSLNAMGIKTKDDMERLLQKWKAEVLREPPLPERTRARNVEMAAGR
jgi:hypothetical protein